VEVVNQDRGAMIGAQRINIGQEVQRGLSDSTAVSGRLALADTTLGSAEQAMDRGASYATVVIPPDFTASLLNLVGVSASGPGSGAADFRNSPLSITGIPQGTSGAEGPGLSLRGCQVLASCPVSSAVGGGYVLATARRVASARARWDRIR
jgi:hypothetical protein